MTGAALIEALIKCRTSCARVRLENKRHGAAAAVVRGSAVLRAGALPLQKIGDAPPRLAHALAQVFPGVHQVEKVEADRPEVQRGPRLAPPAAATSHQHALV